MASGLFSMAPYQWTDTAGASLKALSIAGDMAKSRDKKIYQTSTTKKSGGSGGLGGVLGGIAGGVAGALLPGNWGGAVGSMIGSTLGGTLGGAIDGGYEGATQGAGFGLGLASNNSIGSLMDNIGMSFKQPAGNTNTGSENGKFDSSVIGKSMFFKSLMR